MSIEADDANVNITGDEDDNSNDLNAITRLGRQEAFDENLEGIHAALSKRDSIRSSLASNRNSITTPTTNATGRRKSNISKEEKGENGDRRSGITNQTYKRSSRRLMSEIETEKQPQQQRRHRRPPATGSSSRSLTSSLSKDDGSLSKNNMNAKQSERRRRHHNQRQSSQQQLESQKKSSSDGRLVRSASAINKLLEYDEGGDYSSMTKDSNADKKDSEYPLFLALSKSRDSSVQGIGGGSIGSHERRQSTGRKSRTTTHRRRRSRSSSAAPYLSNNTNATSRADEPQQELRQQRRRRSSSQHHRHPPQLQKERGDENKNTDNRYGRRSLSLQSDAPYQPQPQPQPQPQHEQEEGQQTEKGTTEESFEKVWEKKNPSGQRGRLDPTQQSPKINSASGTGNGISNDNTKNNNSYNGSDSFSSLPGGPGGKVKKTKLEKIHELQAKCDRYKIEWKNMADERRKCRRDLEDSRGEAMSLKKIVEMHEQESKKLQTKLAEAQDELETTRTEQRKERTELSEAAKDLARVNIDYAKSVGDARTVKTKLDSFKEILADRDEKISALEEELRISVENTQHLEADVLYADDQIVNLEKEIKNLEEEVTMYREAADRDSLSDPNGNGNGENLREAKNETEKRMYEERENNIEKKSRILEEQIKEFEEERRRHLEEQEKRERDFENNQAREDINQLLKTFEDENVALKGRLKSEQLDSTVKFQSKDNAIAELQTKVVRLTTEQKERDSAPDSSPSLLQEIETLKADATTSKMDFEDAQMKKIELQNEVNDLQLVNKEMTTCVSTLEAEIAKQKKEADNQKRKTVEWQKKSGAWSDKAFKWKEKSEHWERKAKESNNDSASVSDDAVQADPQALFLAAAVEKKAANTSTANGNGSTWRLGRGIFTKPSESEDETQDLIGKLEADNCMKETEIKTLKSEMVKIQTNFKEQAYSKTQQFEQLLREKEAIELKNANLLKELELARKLNQTISESVIE